MSDEQKAPLAVAVRYEPSTRRALLSINQPTHNTIWARLKLAASASGQEPRLSETSIEIGWAAFLDILNDYGSKEQQITHDFRFRTEGEARELIRQYSEERRKVLAAQGSLQLALSEGDIVQRLKKKGFVKRDLKWFQKRDVRQLLALANGANFSVPGAGKTTVSFAVHLLASQPGQHALVVCPKAAFPAWAEIVDECMDRGLAGDSAEPFQILSGNAYSVERALAGGGRRFVINYDLMIQMPDVIAGYLSRNPVHLIVDESHRMKAGAGSQRGALLLSLAWLPVRRDILSGTPMPQGKDDIISQLNFLWPGQGLGRKIASGRPPREVLGDLYVRTTKEQLGLPPRKTHFHQINMAKGQLALYALVRDESLRQLSGIRSGIIDFAGARKSVMRLLQLSSNPILALQSITGDIVGVNSGLIDQILEDGPSPKMRAVAELARNLARANRKSVIWTIFTANIEQMASMLADLNPVTLYGAVPSGDPTDFDTREGRIKRFHDDDDCMVMIANPAAAGEGISLHMAAHEALYLDRSYVSTHFLQSIDRIHRLGLPEGTTTNVHIFQTRSPMGLGCIDHSVSRRLAKKVRALQELLDDEDLNKIALDEENADEPIDYDIDVQDLVDLVEELEGRKAFDENEGV
ncbi:DEAD/DEAH box helicase [Cupriavidus alkaliphilus]|uniref:DEAD/DEAH box helicase n=1 Tax=Cupriavidus alkaliphilus TaxID=942866 RepID=UPI00339D5405